MVLQGDGIDSLNQIHHIATWNKSENFSIYEIYWQVASMLTYSLKTRSPLLLKTSVPLAKQRTQIERKTQQRRAPLAHASHDYTAHENVAA